MKRVQQFNGYLVVALIALTGINAVLKGVVKAQAQSDLARKANQLFATIPPEQMFVQRDGYTDPTAIQAYTTLLNRLDHKCREGRNEIAVMVHALNIRNREAGFEETFFETLQVYTQAAESGFERRGNCMEVYTYLRPEEGLEDY
jgi:hypothetical protein